MGLIFITLNESSPAKVAWIQISFNTNKNAAEIHAEYLMKAGAVSITLEDAADEPIFEPPPDITPLWPHTRVIGLFHSDINLTEIKNFLNQNLEENILQTLQVENLEEQNWISAWMDQFQPLQFGDKLWICPSYHTIPDPTAINVLLDPGIAFGTGTHPTTRLCLEWLEKHPPQQLTLIDYGCGSGILGIAALKLGASFVYAIDHDVQALQSTQNNAQKNHLNQNNIITLSPEEISLVPKAHLILANILADTLIELLPIFTRLVKKNGSIILSGILENQIPILLQHYQTYFQNFLITTCEGWALLGFRKIKDIV